MNFSDNRFLKRIRKQIKDLFYLPLADRKVLFVFTVLVCALVLGLHYLPQEEKHVRELTEEEREAFKAIYQASLKSSRERKGDSLKKKEYYYVAETPRELFPFDPNTADSTQLLSLGFQPWQVRNIYKYRAKGGRFRKAEDIRKIYGMTPELVESLLPYVRISEYYQYIPRDTSEEKTAPRTNSYPKQEKYPAGTIVDLNSCDTTQLKMIPGIGSGYARMIVRYREQLGGFASVSQLREIRHLPDSVLKWFQIQTPVLRKIAINKASLSALKRHPYLNFYQSKVIIDHRRKYGPLQSVHDLSLYEEFPEKDLKRLAPYLDFGR